MTGEIIVCSCVQTQCYVTHDFLYEGPEGTEADGLEAKILNYLHFIFLCMPVTSFLSLSHIIYEEIPAGTRNLAAKHNIVRIA